MRHSIQRGSRTRAREKAHRADRLVVELAVLVVVEDLPRQKEEGWLALREAQPALRAARRSDSGWRRTFARISGAEARATADRLTIVGAL